MPSRFATVAATAALGLALFGAGPAFAADLPIVGTDACDTAVASAETVQSAQSTLNTAQSFLDLLPATAPLEDRVAATKGVTDADEALRGAVAEATGRLCQPPVTETPEPTTTTGPAETTVPTVDKDCSDFDSQEAAQVYFNDHRTMSNLDPDRLDANGNGIACEGAFDEAPSTTVVTETQINNGVVLNPTADDGSVAVTSGSQVTEVPEGSAQTGSL